MVQGHFATILTEGLYMTLSSTGKTPPLILPNYYNWLVYGIADALRLEVVSTNKGATDSNMAEFVRFSSASADFRTHDVLVVQSGPYVPSVEDLGEEVFSFSVFSVDDQPPKMTYRAPWIARSPITIPPFPVDTGLLGDQATLVNRVEQCLILPILTALTGRDVREFSEAGVQGKGLFVPKS